MGFLEGGQRLVVLAKLLMGIAQMGKEHPQLDRVIARQVVELRNRRRQRGHDLRVPAPVPQRLRKREIPPGTLVLHGDHPTGRRFGAREIAKSPIGL